MKEVLRQRMYHLVLYNISPIQQGIQSYHAGIEYALIYWKTKEFQRWAKKDKTVIVLNGGTSNKEGKSVYDETFEITNFGSMEKHLHTLGTNDILCTPFYEPDLNNATTAIAFLADERVWDKEKYPDPERKMIGGKEYSDKIFYEDMTNLYGEDVAFLRIFLSPFRLA